MISMALADDGTVLVITRSTTEKDVKAMLRELWVNKQKVPTIIRGDRYSLANVMEWYGAVINYDREAMTDGVLERYRYVSDFGSLTLQESS